MADILNTICGIKAFSSMDNYVLLLYHNLKGQHDRECGQDRTTPNHCVLCALLSTQNRHCIAQYERAMNMATTTVYQLELQLVDHRKREKKRTSEVIIN